MKKTYIAPKQIIVKIKTAHQMLSGSGLTGTLDRNQTIENSDDFGARGFDFEDEE